MSQDIKFNELSPTKRKQLEKLAREQKREQEKLEKDIALLRKKKKLSLDEQKRLKEDYAKLRKMGIVPGEDKTTKGAEKGLDKTDKKPALEQDKKSSSKGSDSAEKRHQTNEMFKSIDAGDIDKTLSAIRGGADLSMTKDGMNIFDYARSKCSPEQVEHLESQAIKDCCMDKDEKRLNRVVQAGVNVNAGASNPSQKSVLEYAVDAGESFVVALSRAGAKDSEHRAEKHAAETHQSESAKIIHNSNVDYRVKRRMAGRAA